MNQGSHSADVLFICQACNVKREESRYFIDRDQVLENIKGLATS